MVNGHGEFFAGSAVFRGRIQHIPLGGFLFSLFAHIFFRLFGGADAFGFASVDLVGGATVGMGQQGSCVL